MAVPDATPEREFTPSMERLRDEYVQMRAEHYGFSDLYAAEFDRALAERDARVRAEAAVGALSSAKRLAVRCYPPSLVSTATVVADLDQAIVRIERGESR